MTREETYAALSTNFTAYLGCPKIYADHLATAAMEEFEAMHDISLADTDIEPDVLVQAHLGMWEFDVNHKSR